MMKKQAFTKTQVSYEVYTLKQTTKQLATQNTHFFPGQET